MTLEIHWGKVARHLKDDAEQIRERAITAFHGDIATQKEMQTRAAILESLANALWYGLE